MMHLKDILLLFLWLNTLMFAQANNCNIHASKMTDFPDLSRIKSSNTTSTFMKGRQYLFPRIKFNCEVYITKWMYKGSLRESEQQQYPIFQLWDNELNLLYLRDQSTGYNDIKHYNQTEDDIVEIILITPLKVDDDCFFGVYIPENPSPIYFDKMTATVQHLSIESDDQRSTVLFIEEFFTGNDLIPLVTVELYTTTTVEKKLQQTTIEVPSRVVTVITPTAIMNNQITPTAILNNQITSTAILNNQITSTLNTPDQYSITTKSVTTLKNSNVNETSITIPLNDLNTLDDGNILTSTSFLYTSLGIITAVVGIGIITLLLIIFTVKTFIIIKVMNRKRSSMTPCHGNRAVLNNDYLRNSLVFNQAYYQAHLLDDRYDRLTRTVSTHELEPTDRFMPISKINTTHTASMPEIRFSQSIPLPAVPQSLPLPPPSILQDDSFFLPRSNTISTFYQVDLPHVYDLPFVDKDNSAYRFRVPRQYEQPL